MLSVLIETLDDEQALAQTLNALIAAVVEGVVREVIVLDRGSRDQTVKVSEHAGCTTIEGGSLIDAIRPARGDWLLVIEPGARPAEGWTESVLDHVAPGAKPARFAVLDQSSWLKRLWQRPTALAAGLLIEKSQALLRAGSPASSAELAASIRSVRLAAGIRPPR